MMQKRPIKTKELASPSSPGERLRLWRRHLSLTQAELGGLLGVDMGTLRKYELGVNAPGSVYLSKVCAYGLNINWVLLGIGHMYTPKHSESLTGDAAAKMAALSEAMAELHQINEAKFSILASGFMARVREVIRLAELEEMELNYEAGLGDAYAAALQKRAILHKPLIDDEGKIINTDDLSDIIKGGI